MERISDTLAVHEGHLWLRLDAEAGRPTSTGKAAIMASNAGGFTRPFPMTPAVRTACGLDATLYPDGALVQPRSAAYLYGRVVTVQSVTKVTVKK